MSLSNIRIVLKGPLYGGNVGSVCRAMGNMGFADLAIADPRPLDMEEARKMACGSGDILERRREFPTLADAIADCGPTVGTTARTGLYRQQARPPREWTGTILELSETCPVALVFGPEDSGLANEDLALCTHIVQIPTVVDRSSLNLAQAVLICCYELFVATEAYSPPVEKSPPAPSALRERMFTMWHETMLATGFAKPDKAPHMMMGLRRILSRGALTEDDVHILMGMAQQASWCAEQMRRPQSVSEPVADDR